jgi:cytochrome b involved in lipid metabolism
MSEVKKHNKDGDAWVVIHGNVVDVSDFVPRHPGGKAVLQQFAGKVRRRRCFYCAHGLRLAAC